MKTARFDAALASIERHAPVMSPERLPLTAALGRILGKDVAARSDHPRFDCSAMDGFALVAAATAGGSDQRPVILPVAGESRAGKGAEAVDAGHACRISTGAPLLAPFDAVVARERVALADGAIHIAEAVDPGRNVRRRAEDATQGEIVASRGRLVTPEAIGSLCCFGVTDVAVLRMPRITLLPTGDEIAAHGGGGGGDWGIHDSNGPMIAAMLGQLGVTPKVLAPARDQRGALRASVVRALEDAPDIIVSTGGVSAGEHDHVPAVLTTLGARIHFHGVAMRPGKPVLFASLPDGSLFFGLPGNPVAAAVGCRFFIAAALRAMLGLRREAGIRFDFDPGPMRSETLILKARWSPDLAAPIPAADQRSHTMRPLVTTNAWIVAQRAPDETVSSSWFAAEASLAD